MTPGEIIHDLMDEPEGEPSRFRWLPIEDDAPWTDAVVRSWPIGTGFPEAFAEISAEWVWEPADLTFYRRP